MSLETTEKVVCIGCGQAVALRDGSFCMNACRKRELRARHRRARLHLCVGCGKAFNNRRRDTRFCSAACKQAAYRLRLEAAEEEARRAAEAARKAAEAAAEVTRRAIDLAHALIG